MLLKLFFVCISFSVTLANHIQYTKASCDDLVPRKIQNFNPYAPVNNNGFSPVGSFPQSVSNIPQPGSNLPQGTQNVPQNGAGLPQVPGSIIPAAGPNFPAPSPNFPAPGPNFPSQGTNFALPQAGVDESQLDPILMTTLSPFRITVNDNRYRRGRIMKVKIEGRDYFEAFVMEARALGGGPTSKVPIAGVGRWMVSPGMASLLDCRERAASAVTNIQAPIRMNTVNFTWEAPYSDVGDIYFIASVLSGNRYWIFTSDRLRINPFPGEITGCGFQRTCFRLCNYDPLCSPEAAEYIVIFDVDYVFNKEVAITLGGKISNNNTYIAIGFASSYYYTTKMDINACMIDDNRVVLGHYRVESDYLPPFLHSGVILPDVTDTDSDYIWCRFRRPLRNLGHNSIDPSQAFYHYYFKGFKNSTGIYLPPRSMMNISPYARNLTEYYSEIQWSYYSAAAIVDSHVSLTIFCILIFVFF